MALPATDVAPKSEVDDWKEIAEGYRKMFEDSYSKYQAKVDKLSSELAKCKLDLHYSRKEVAREIFEEIEKLFFKNGVFIHIQSYNELKKKYTEGGECR